MSNRAVLAWLVAAIVAGVMVYFLALKGGGSAGAGAIVPSGARVLTLAPERVVSLSVGNETVCYLDPDAPELVVLKKDSKAALYTIWFPCLFIVGGAGMIFSALFRKKA